MEGINNGALASSFTATLRTRDMTSQGMTAAMIMKDDPASPSAPRVRTEEEEEEMDRLRKRFRSTLLSRYHTMVGAWLQMDPRGHGRISFYDFCRACRDMGYERETKPLWEALDRNRDGFVSLDELHGRTAKLLAAFRAALVEAHGSAEVAWGRCFSPNGKDGFGRCKSEAFLKGCRDVNFSGDADAVFTALNVERTSMGITQKEFNMLDQWFKSSPPHGNWDYEHLRPSSQALPATN
mmetsp:Transcript_42076/g.111053  ORF Transcript_42076/g.111053 Transcript_42076/m.111053 type:complete len:238 (-) Transcript_42076:52-765(-)